ncbi:MAG: tryptophan synthase subunit alpha [Anaerohalosphaeraceae bacterium]|nr:tryptophan synthase subunit alpha [Anaerohalosphaeraceae bacterium]
MRTYKQVFSELKHAALIPFFVIGDPDIDSSFEIVKAAIDSGADVLELGIAFSDPIADGPTIQKADIRALDNGVTVAKALEFIKKVKAYKDIPIGLLMYYNLIFQYGLEKFYEDFHNAGVNSVLVADLSIDDADEIAPAINAAGLDTVFMVTPNTEVKRIELIASKTTGFIYTVSLLGVTGGRQELSDMVRPLVAKLKSVTDVPVCVGFGVSTAEHATQLAKAGADGVIIGSRLVKIIEKNPGDTAKAVTEISTFLKEVKTAIAAV